MVTKKYTGIKGLEDAKNNNEMLLEDKIVWMQMLEKIILQEHSLALVNKIKTYFMINKELNVETFNNFVREISHEVKDMEYKKLKEEVDKEMNKK